MKQLYLVAILFAVIISHTHAADLRGKLTGIPGATVKVSCTGNLAASTIISSDGRFFISGLPANQSCSFTVLKGDMVSSEKRFSTGRTISSYNGSLRIVNGRIFVIIN